jgi:glutathione synthase
MSKKRQILLIDSLNKLVVKKDSTLFLALEMQNQGIETYVFFEKDFYIRNHGELKLNVYKFKGEIDYETFYLKSFELDGVIELQPSENDLFHMRLDPPFDTRYLRFLWMFGFIEKMGAKVINSPEGILRNNEKIMAYEHPCSLQSYVGTAFDTFISFCEDLKSDGHKNLIIKPLDLYQGIGVRKLSLDDYKLEEIFKNAIKEFQGPIVAQPFFEGIVDGEIRTVFYKCKELGTILKTPVEGDFLANIAQGAGFAPAKLNPIQEQACLEICKILEDQGVDWVAFDVLGNYISEVNVTCPGLLVEVSQAMKKNLALEIINCLD